MSSRTGAVRRAISEGDAGKITATTTQLIAQSSKTGDTFSHALKLLGALREIAQESGQKSPQELDKQIRTTWSEIKAREKIPKDKALDRLVLDAARKALGGRE
jgi:hypothetical protein